MENLREAAHSIYEEYLSEKAGPRLKLEDTIVKRLLFKIRTEPPDPDWFGEVQGAVFDKLQGDERFFESFRRSMGYVKLLAELDLLKDATASSTKSEDDEDEEEASIYDTLSLNSLEGSRGSLDEIIRSGGEGEAEDEEESAQREEKAGDVTLTEGETQAADKTLTSVKRHRR